MFSLKLLLHGFLDDHPSNPLHLFLTHILFCLLPQVALHHLSVVLLAANVVEQIGARQGQTNQAEEKAVERKTHHAQNGKRSPQDGSQVLEAPEHSVVSLVGLHIICALVDPLFRAVVLDVRPPTEPDQDSTSKSVR